MQTRRRRKQAALSVLQLPDSYLHELVHHLSPSSKLALRATCKAFLHAVDGASKASSEEALCSRNEASQACSQLSQLQDAVNGLRLRVATRKPSFSALHAVQMLHNVVVLDTQAALRGALCIGCTNPTEQLVNSMPALQLAAINNSQASLLDLLVHAAPQLSNVQLGITSSAPRVVTQLSHFSHLTSLEMTLAHPGWMKGCADLGQLTQLQRLVVLGKPLDEANKHGIGAVSSMFWENSIATLTGLTSLHANPWIKNGPEAGSVTYSTLKNLRQLHVPYCTGKTGPGATSSLLSQLSSCSLLTSLCFGVHEFNWDVSRLSDLTQLKELEIHNPFLKEVWGLQPFTAAALAPLTAATGLTSLTLSHLRLPTLPDTMATAGQAVAAVAAQPGAAAALADALASGDGPAADIVHAIAAAAVASVLRGAAAAAAAGAGAAGSSEAEGMRAVWCAVADTLQQQAAAVVAAASRQLPAAYGAQAAAAAAAAAAAGPGLPVGLQAMQLPGTAAADSNALVTAAPVVASAATGTVVPPEMLALAHEVIAAMAKHTALRLQQQQQQQQQQRPVRSVCEGLKQQYLRAAHALAASVGPVVAAAAAAGAALPGGQLPAYLAVPPPPAQALVAAHLAAQVAGGNPVAAAAALAGPPLGFVAVPAVPPPVVPPPPLPGQQQQPPAAVPAVGIPAAVPAAGLAAVSTTAANAAAVAAAAAAKASASWLFEQVPVLPSLKRLTVGTTHGRLLAGVQIAAMAPGLTCLEDLSELPRVPPVASDILGGLAQLQLLTVNVDTLQLYARHASLTGLRGLQNISSSADAGSGNPQHGSGCDSQNHKADVADRQVAPTAAAAAPQPATVLGASSSKPSKKGAKQAASAAANVSKKKGSRGSRAAQQAAADAEALAHEITAAAFPAAAAAATPAVTGTDAKPPGSAAAPAAGAGAQAVPTDSGSSREVKPAMMLHLGSSWRQLSNLCCLRLLMLGHLQSPDTFSEVRILPTIPGVTRLELCSAFGGSLDYAETYTIEEDPYLWQEQVGVEELIVDGGVLLGGFMVDAGMAALLKQKLRRLRKLVLCRCLDLTVGYLETAMQRGLAPLIVVKRDCRLVSEGDVVRLNERLRGSTGVMVEFESVGPQDYEGKSFTYAIDE